MGYQKPKANWELWAHMLTATLREAVLLSLDMEPNPPALKRSFSPEKYNAPGTDFERLLQIALSHVDAGTLPLEHGPRVFSRDAHMVKLHTFEAWARSVGWVLPESFPKAIEQAAPAQATATHAPAAVAALVEPDKARNEFSMTKAAMVKQYEHEWPTLKRDMADASTNGLAAAKAGPRGWYKSDAMEWARANNKLANTSKSASSLTQAMNSMKNLPGRKHTSGG